MIKTAKNLLVAITLVSALFALNANADWQNGGRPGPGGPGFGGRPGWGNGNGPGRPGNPGWGGGGGGGGGNGGGNVSCRATDTGWEEHWGGHGSCGECLSKHGSCNETCSQTSYQCRAEGTNRSGQTESFEAYAPQDFRARDEAVNRCYYSGASNCHVVNCATNEQVVSRRSCR